MKLIVEGPKIVTLFLEIPYKMKLYPLTPGKIALHPMELPGPKTKTFFITPENSGKLNRD